MTPISLLFCILFSAPVWWLFNKTQIYIFITFDKLLELVSRKKISKCEFKKMKKEYKKISGRIKISADTTAAVIRR